MFERTLGTVDRRLAASATIVGSNGAAAPRSRAERQSLRRQDPRSVTSSSSRTPGGSGPRAGGSPGNRVARAGGASRVLAAPPATPPARGLSERSLGPLPPSGPTPNLAPRRDPATAAERAAVDPVDHAELVPATYRFHHEKTEKRLFRMFRATGTGHALWVKDIAYTRKRDSGPFLQSQAASGGESVARFPSTGSWRAKR